MNRFTSIVGGLVLAFAFGACGGGYSGFLIPIESELKPWVAPEEDELLGDDLMEDDGEEEEFEDYEDEEEEETPAAGAPAPAPK